MNAHNPLAAAFSTDAPGWERPAFERQIALLGEVAEAGLEVVHAIRDQAVAANACGAEPSRIDFGLAYTRAARAVRMTLALQRRYILDLRFEFRHGEPAPAWDKAPRAPAAAVDRIGHGLATGGLGEAQAVKALNRALDDYERLDDELDADERLEDLDDIIPDGPAEALIAKICKDLGLAPDWLQRTEERLWGGKVGAPSADSRSSPLPLDGGEAGSGGDGSAAVRRTGHPHPLPFAHQGGREPHAASP
jgi:hypothetical protein